MEWFGATIAKNNHPRRGDQEQNDQGKEHQDSGPEQPPFCFAPHGSYHPLILEELA
jgi:hypothetical protein